ncbi:transporter [Sneathiella chinensis]|uniref:TRAP transporter small permease protein n=1 Tax=Sneathiella chinensis TaxID=349750 RepID=A0ABQ5U5G6_9PROT|nr:transporter [Sneathiella chinensis]
MASSFLGKAMGMVALAAGILSAFLVIFTLALTGYSVFQRYVLGTPLTWTDELSGFLVVAIVMLGAADILRRGEHISVDLLSSKAKGGLALGLKFWGFLATAFVAGVMCLSAVEAVQFSIDFEVFSDGYLEAPLWIPQSTLLVGSGLLCLIALVKAFDVLRGGRKKQ